jgi:hypothetical protein
LGAELGTDNGNRGRQIAQNINNQHPTTWNQQQPTRATTGNLQATLTTKNNQLQQTDTRDKQNKPKKDKTKMQKNNQFEENSQKSTKSFSRKSSYFFDFAKNKNDQNFLAWSKD